MKKEEMKLLTEELRRMAETDIRAVDPEDLVELENVQINKELPVQDRVQDYIRQIKNPYCYISHRMVVKIGFSGTKTLEECLGACVSIEA